VFDDSAAYYKELGQDEKFEANKGDDAKAILGRYRQYAVCGNGRNEMNKDLDLWLSQ
jgi:hypothetical protein